MSAIIQLVGVYVTPGQMFYELGMCFWLTFGPLEPLNLATLSCGVAYDLE